MTYFELPGTGAGVSFDFVFQSRLFFSRSIRCEASSEAVGPAFNPHLPNSLGFFEQPAKIRKTRKKVILFLMLIAYFYLPGMGAGDSVDLTNQSDLLSSFWR